MPQTSHRIAEFWANTLHAFGFRMVGKWFFLSALIGLVAGVGAIIFQWMGMAIQHYGLAMIAGWHGREPLGEWVPHFFEGGAPVLHPWLIVVIMTAGGLVSGWLVYTFAPEAEGHGTDAAIDAFHNKRGVIKPRIPIIKILASAVTLGTGGSAGREGPIAQIGAGFGSILATKLRLSDRDRRIMLAAGMGAGVGAIFKAPLAGALFAGEILYRDADLESDVIVPAAISSTVAYSVYCYSLPVTHRFSPLFGKINFGMDSPLELLPYTVMAILLVLVGVLYIKTFYGMHDLFKKLPIIPHLRPAIGAALAGLVGVGMLYACQDENALAVLGTGYGSLQAVLSVPSADALADALPTNPVTIAPLLLIAIALVKILTTSLTISSGGSGGVFGPSMVIGGCVGGAMGQWFHDWLPTGMAPNPQAFAIVGMAGFFAGCARAPFSTILMVSEMTGDYRLLLPTMWVCTICFLLGQKWTLYVKQVPTRLDSPAHRGDFIVDLLEGMRVADVYSPNRKIRTIDEGASLDAIVHMLATTSQRYFPVVDQEKKIVGIFSADDVRAYLYDDTLWQLANARDVMTSRVATITPEDDLNTALNHFTAYNVDELPVVDAEDRATLLGVLRHKELIAAYNQKVIAHKKLVETESGGG
ncbi:chloride channel protein [Lignipirellula cremea]|uniref:H(+)/Cl(-) exchange transporter ClcA n=1 Tax=Lignipirellula cremea TaxID=2528010 RepID=A0A518E4S0_9BACT|nr:chloride channel protein [Lignipirellula cremea]QDU99063.1 H(+)/Cl(-) exchange transporter ClcA [Lignipirellula cremea]